MVKLPGWEQLSKKRQARAVELYTVHNLSRSVIAQRLGIDSDTVSKYLNRAGVVPARRREQTDG